MESFLERLAPCDLVLVEGYKQENHEKIEVIRNENGKDAPRWTEDKTIVAVAASTVPPDCTLPCFDPDDLTSIADFIMKRLAIAMPGDRHAAE